MVYFLVSIYYEFGMKSPECTPGPEAREVKTSAPKRGVCIVRKNQINIKIGKLKLRKCAPRQRFRQAERLAPKGRVGVPRGIVRIVFIALHRENLHAVLFRIDITLDPNQASFMAF